MLRILIDHDILRGLIRRLPKLDFVTAFEVGLSEVEDPKILIWAAAEKRILLTHDRKTMPGHLAALSVKNENLSGVFIVPRRLPIGQAIAELEIMIDCSMFEEWENIVKILPL